MIGVHIDLQGHIRRLEQDKDAERLLYEVEMLNAANLQSHLRRPFIR